MCRFDRDDIERERERDREREREREKIGVGEVCRWRTLSLILIDLLPPVSPHPFPPVSSLFLSPAFQAAPTGCSVSVDQRDCFFSRLSSLKTPTFPALSRRLIAFVLYLSFRGWEHCLWVIFFILILARFKRRLSFFELQDFGIFLVG